VRERKKRKRGSFKAEFQYSKGGLGNNLNESKPIKSIPAKELD
jgi:hypothetical protein